MTEVTIITDEARTVPGATSDGRVGLVPEGIGDALGWELKDRGLCRGEVCVPVAEPAGLFHGDLLDVAAVSAALGRLCVVDVDAAMAAVAEEPTVRQHAVHGLEAPDFRLPDLDGVPHELSEWHGHKKLLVTFSSWCGCRYDLPGWQALDDELAAHGFRVVAVAMDDDPEDVRPFTEGIDLPVLLDRQHLLSERYAISNVPTVVWIDEVDRIVRPNGVAFGTDTFKSFTGAAAGPHLDQVRRWVIDGEVPVDTETARQVVADLTDDEVRARLHFRVAAEARRRDDAGRDDQATARRHFASASALAPLDFTIRPAAMPLLGQDPFGQGFLDIYEEWQAAGMPYHGFAPSMASPEDASTDR